MAAVTSASRNACLPVALSTVTEPITSRHVRPLGHVQTKSVHWKAACRFSALAARREGSLVASSLREAYIEAPRTTARLLPVRSSAQSGEQETAEAAAAARSDSLMPNFTWTPSPPSQAFRSATVRSSHTGIVPFNFGPAGRGLSLQSISKEEALGVVISAAMGTGWKTLTGLEGPSAPPSSGVDSVDSLDSGGMPIISPVSPRRTARVDFTCNKCGSRTRRAINPHAYKEGTVFVQCQGCHVYHKLVDHLNLFHELAGSVFHGSDAGQHGFGGGHTSVDVLGLDRGSGGGGYSGSSSGTDLPFF